MTGQLESRKRYAVVGTSYGQRARLRAAYGADKWLRPASGMVLQVKAPVDERLLAEALTIVARRHSALRTFFPRHLAPDFAACILPDDSEWPLSVANESAISQFETQEMRRLHRPFSPDDPPLLRAALLRQDTEKYLIGLAVDHLNFDGESVPSLARDLTSVWRLLDNGAEASRLSALVKPYEQFACWQQEWLVRMGEEAFAYWAPQWESAGPFPKLPFPDPEEASVEGSRARTWEHSLPLADVQRRGRALGKGHFTEFMLVAAALLKVISKQFGISEPGLLFPFSNRLTEGFSEAIGYYNNRLLLRPPLGNRSSFADVADEVRRAAFDSFKYGPFPFDLIGERLFPEELSRRPNNKHLYLSIVKVGQEYVVPGGSATEVSIDVARDMSADPGMLVSYVIDQSEGMASLQCTYGPSFYAATDIDLFMSEVLDNLMISG